MSMLEKLVLKNGPNSSTTANMAFDMILAGIDTTGTALAFSLYLLSSNPEKQAILRDEVQTQLAKDNGRVTEADLAKMKYLRAVIREQGRLHPVGGGGARYIVEDVNLSGYLVPAKTLCIWNLDVMSRDENNFQEAER